MVMRLPRLLLQFEVEPWCAFGVKISRHFADKTAVVIGTGRIGSIVARLLWHLRCKVVAYDHHQSDALKELGVTYTDTMEEALVQADIIALNCPLTPETKHLIGPSMIPKLKRGVMVVNTGRGPLVDTEATIQVRGVPSGHQRVFGLRRFCALAGCGDCATTVVATVAGGSRSGRHCKRPPVLPCASSRLALQNLWMWGKAQLTNVRTSLSPAHELEAHYLRTNC